MMLTPCIFALISTLEEDEDKEYALELYSRFRKLLYATVSSILGKKLNADIEDTVHDVFIDLLKRMDTLRSLDDYSLHSYLYHAAKNASLNKLRKLGRAIPSEDYILEALKNKGIPLEDSFEYQMLATAILSQLSQTQQDILRYRFLEDYSIEQIAKAMHMPKNLVGSTLTRAKRKALQYCRKKGIFCE